LAWGTDDNIHRKEKNYLFFLKLLGGGMKVSIELINRYDEDILRILCEYEGEILAKEVRFSAAGDLRFRSILRLMAKKGLEALIELEETCRILEEEKKLLG
jgi:hypothetical protein